MNYEFRPMDVLCFGSINIDHQYAVDHFVSPGETLACLNYTKSAGGKGLNQSIALGRAGADVTHAGAINEQDGWLIELLSKNNIHTQHIELSQTPTGHAIIQINTDGENCILLHGGANRTISEAHIDTVLECRAAGTWLLLQNEINNQAYIIQQAVKRGLRIAINPAPMDASVRELPLGEVDLIVVNETEIREFTGLHDLEKALQALREQYAKPLIILTKGSQGSVAIDTAGRRHEQAVIPTLNVIDSTAAGDSYIGYFLASYAKGGSIECAMRYAAEAASIAVSRAGAAASIPFADELKSYADD